MRLLPEPDEDVLGDLLRPGTVAEEPACERDDRFAMPMHDLGHRTLVSMADRHDEVRVGGIRLSRRHGASLPGLSQLADAVPSREPRGARHRTRGHDEGTKRCSRSEMRAVIDTRAASPRTSKRWRITERRTRRDAVIRAAKYSEDPPTPSATRK